MKTALAFVLLVAALAAGNAGARQGILVRFSDEQKLSRYIEGYVWFVSLDRARPRRVRARSILLGATPGRHVLRIFIRPCDANCSHLDAPQKRCSAVVHIGQTATYHLRDRRCRITVRG